MMLLPIIECFSVILAVSFHELVFGLVIVFAPDLLPFAFEVKVKTLLGMDLLMASRMDINLHSVFFGLLAVRRSIEDVMPLSTIRIDLAEADRTVFDVPLNDSLH